MAFQVQAPAFAAETGRARLGDDYAQFQIGGADWRPCEHECTVDASCKSWTYITAVGQCRLKHGIPPAVANNCCVTGVKDEAGAAAEPNRRNEDETECARIAVAAIDANNDNLGARCGLTGPLWSSAYPDVYGRCLESSPARRGQEAQERKRSLQICKQTAELGRGLICDHYARMAVAENVTNTSNNCGFDGPEWSADYDAHAHFCREAQRAGVADRIAGRERQLAECLNRGGGRTDDDCQAYATQSADQFAKSSQMRCGDAFTGLGWSANPDEHYRWCRSHGRPEREAALRRRQEALDVCGVGRDMLRKIFKF